MTSKNRTRDIFYYLGLLLVTISSTMVGRTYLFQIPYLNPSLKYGAIVFLMLSFFSRKWKRGELIKSIALIGVVLAVAIITDSNMMLIYLLAIVLSRPGDFDRICRFLFWSNLILIICVFVLCGIGILKDEIIVHTGVQAHTLGFAYYSSPAYSVMFLTMMGFYLYSGNKHTYRRILFFIVSFVANYVIYKLTTTRLTFYIYILLLCMIIILDYTKVMRKVRLNRIVGTVMFPVMFALSVLLPAIYTKSSVLKRLDTLLNGRLYFSAMGFARYKVNLFGNQIITNAGGFDENWHNTYFYIDSGYVKLLLGYGLIVCLVVIAVYMMCSRYAANHKNTKLYIWCVLVCVFSFINDPLTDVILNPLLFISVPLFHELRIERKLSKAGGVILENVDGRRL